MPKIVNLCHPVFFQETCSELQLSWASSKPYSINFWIPEWCRITFLSFYQNLDIFGVIGSELWIFDSRPPNFTPWFYAHSFRASAYLWTLCKWLPEILPTWGSNLFLLLTEILLKVWKFSSGLCMQLFFIVMRIYPCAHVCIRFLHLSLISDVCLRIHDRWCAGVDSLELPREGCF
jgi:hypothetical protein